MQLVALGVFEIEAENDIYDRNLQKAKEQIPTKDESLNQTVVQVLGLGYRTDKKILRKQEVSIYTYQKPSKDES